MNQYQAAAEQAFAQQGGSGISAETKATYAKVHDAGHEIPAIPDTYLSGEVPRQAVSYFAPYPPGTIVVDPGERRLYHVQAGHRAMRYSVGVGAAGRAFTGQAQVALQKAWPRWSPTPRMLREDPATYEPVRGGLPGGPDNPLGARALYLYQNGLDTLFRIHGTPHPWSVGNPSTAGCIRMFNQDVVHLAAKVANGTNVIVLPESDAGKWTRPN